MVSAYETNSCVPVAAIDDGAGVAEMISVLLPSRKRPAEFARMAHSAWSCAQYPHVVEIVARFDDDDLDSAAAAKKTGAKVLIGPRVRAITSLWNECFVACSGEILMQANDDIIFRSLHWDTCILKNFESYPDRIVMIHGDDMGGCRGEFGPHPFVHRRWAEALGYFIPPYFSSDFGDTWLNDIANALGRRVYLPELKVEHMYWAQGKMRIDSTTTDRLQRHAEDDPEGLYDEKIAERVAAANTLGALMEPPHKKLTVRHLVRRRGLGACPRCESFCTVLVDGALGCNSCGHRWKG